MKRLILGLSLLLIISSCLKFPDLPDKSTDLVLSANGFNSAVGEIYIQRSVPVGLEIAATEDDLNIALATWKIEDYSYQGKQVVHIFNTLGTISLSVEATLSNGAKTTRNFVVKVVDDLSDFDPVIITPLSQTDGKTELLFLFSRERLRYAKDTVLYYIGNLTEWKNIRAVYHSYVLDETGKAIMVSDIGKYVGFKLSLADGQYELALVHSGNIWTDFSGSKYISQENLGRLKFSLQRGEVIPLGDRVAPGILGDGYFRFFPKKYEVEVYFHLDGNYTNSSFYRYQLRNGSFSAPIPLTAVTGHDWWGRATILEAEYLGRVMNLRFGPDQSRPDTYSKNMEKSLYYSVFSKGIEIQWQRL